MVTLSTLKSFLDVLEEGVLFLDAGHRVVEMNEAAVRLLGRQAPPPSPVRCSSVFARACARECDATGACSLTRSEGPARKVQDVRMDRPDGGENTLRMWAMLLPPNEDRLHCAIVLRDRTHEAALEMQVRERWKLGALVGRHPAMQALYAEILRCAGSDANALVTGESGVGKELVAHAIHDNSGRSGGPFVALHCAALPENLLESELFGHARGAFSGATTARIGRFEAAEGGTLLLDEAGELSPAMQTKLLRVLEQREIVRLGENRPRRIDVRVIAATHRDLPAMVARGAFREDLYYRLCVLPLHVPALRQRAADIPLIAGHLLDELGRRYRRPRLQLGADALALLEHHPWPGNVRQLANVLEYAVVHAEGSAIGAAQLPLEIRQPAAPRAVPEIATGDETERDRIQRVLRQCGGNRAEAARRLGMSRTTLWKRLKESALAGPAEDGPALPPA